MVLANAGSEEDEEARVVQAAVDGSTDAAKGETAYGQTDQDPTDWDPTDRDPTDWDPTDRAPTDWDPTDRAPTDRETAALTDVTDRQDTAFTPTPALDGKTDLDVTDRQDTALTPTPAPGEKTDVEVNPQPVVAPQQPGGAQGAGEGSDIEVIVQDAVSVTAGRVTTLVPEGNDIVSVRVLEQPQAGTLSVNADNTLALTLTGTDYTGPLGLSYQVAFSDGRTEVVKPEVTAVEGQVADGWGLGDFYMLETDSGGNLIVEHGDNHRDVYVSGDLDALTLKDIALIEGRAVEDITGRWLVNHPEYGSSPDMALAEDAGNRLWKALSTASYKDPASHWLHLERGHEYEMNGLLHKGMHGESELHPMHMTAYGTGAKPIVTKGFQVTGEGVKNVVISDIAFTDGGFLNPSTNLIMENVTSTGGAEFAILQSEGVTLRNSEIYDIHKEAPGDAEEWNESKDRISGIYIGRGTESVLIENTLFDRNGWEEGYYGLDPDSPQAPSIYNHNVYIAASVTDLTFRENISMRGASFGAQFRGGAVVEDNVFIDNNAAVYVAGGVKDDGNYYGNYSLYSGNVITSAAHRDYGLLKGQVAGGIGDYAPETTLIDNIVAHMADPNNPLEQAEKGKANFALKSDTHYYNDTIVYNWTGSDEAEDARDANVDGLSETVLDATTIQNFAAQLLGNPDASIDDLALYLRASAEGAFDGVSDASLIADFFRSGFGIQIADRVTSETLRFEPDDLADGVRWDNRMNWSTDDLPGTVAGDSVDLADNMVIFGGTHTIDDLDFGNGGELHVDHGRLNVTGETMADAAGGRVEITAAGQFWMAGHSDSDRLTVEVAGGRFANTGVIDGQVDISVSGGQALLATEAARLDLSAGSRLEVIGDDARVGFEGTAGGPAALRLETGSTLRYEAQDGGIGRIGEFRSGANGTAENDVASGANLGSGTLEIDLANLDAAAGRHTLLSVDEMVGAFSEIKIENLAADRDAKLVIDYALDELTLLTSTAGQGAGGFKVVVQGDQNDARNTQELWKALTSDQPVLSETQVPETVTVNDQEVMDFL